MTRVVYLGAVVSNGGDAAIMEAQIAALDRAYPGHVAVLHDNAPTVARRTFPRCEVLPPTGNVVNRPAGPGKHREAMRRLNRVRVRTAARLWRTAGERAARAMLTGDEAAQLSSMARAEVVAYTGGTSLIEKYSLKSKLFEIELSSLLGRPVVLLPQSVGPFGKAENKRLMRRLMKSVDLTLLRDERSLSHLRDIDADTSSVRVVPDIVFALAEPGDVDRLRQSGEVPSSGARIAISVRDCRLFYGGTEAERAAGQVRYEEAIAGLAEELCARGASVTFLSTCQGVPEYWTDDSEVAVSIVGRLPEGVRDQVTVDDSYHSVRDLKDSYGTFDLVVCTRLHASILALDAGTPVLPVAYEFKTHEVMKQLGLADVVVDIADISRDRLVQSLDTLTAELPSRRDALATALASMVAQTASTGSQVQAAVESHASR
ncbi:polysaccharide pyruvyl transferase family protein [Nocardioides flavescens]|uniref:Polysaccharide pyruvyl transferase domain-containing protein n=1 Tax=Nocardioides flavescens TaxID=2691959 RepID=A0A6L7EZW5_9ACTN|nr:polysaccharide pyruvyl transferase family protein [Nocardioides flavescens]MXG89969.1 hypothetical protein [Nocardioides flavescens]